jgi:MYXO-CTERM domain-containing protein
MLPSPALRCLAVTAACLWGAEAWAQIVLEQHKAMFTPGGVMSGSLTLDKISRPGSLLVVVTGWSPATETPNLPTDSQGNPYFLIKTDGALASQLVGLYYAQNTAGGTIPTVTWTVTGSPTTLSLEVAEFSGVSGFSGLFTSQQVSPANGSGTPSSGPVVPPLGESLIIGALSHDANGTTDAGPGFVLLDVATDNSTNNNPAADEYRIINSAAALPADATFTLTTPAAWAAIVAVFSPLDAGAPDSGQTIDAGPADSGNDAGGTPDSGTPDSGGNHDSGVSPDGGAPPDSGANPDSGSVPDSGTAIRDSGIGGDAGSGASQTLPEFGWSCGCGASPGAALGALILIAAARRRRRSRGDARWSLFARDERG